MLKKTKQEIQNNTNISIKGSDVFPLSIGINWVHRLILTNKQFVFLEYLIAKLIFPLKLVSASSPNLFLEIKIINQNRNRTNMKWKKNSNS